MKIGVNKSEVNIMDVVNKLVDNRLNKLQKDIEWKKLARVSDATRSQLKYSVRV